MLTRGITIAQAQLELHHPNEALSSALRAYELCISTPSQTSSAFPIANLVLRCKRGKWEVRERQRLRQREDLMSELLDKLDVDRRTEITEIEEEEAKGNMGRVEADERRTELKEDYNSKMEELRNVFAIADPSNLEKREVPEYLVDDISFEIMHDRKSCLSCAVTPRPVRLTFLLAVMTRNGHSYERATIMEHLKKNPIDPLTRDPLLITELRPNLALRKACDEFWEKNSGWAYDW